MHDSGVCTNRPSQDIIGISKVDNDNLVPLVNSLAYTDETIRFEC
jgi:hypothetical protein